MQPPSTRMQIEGAWSALVVSSATAVGRSSKNIPSYVRPAAIEEVMKAVTLAAVAEIISASNTLDVGLRSRAVELIASALAGPLHRRNFNGPQQPKLLIGHTLARASLSAVAAALGK